MWFDVSAALAEIEGDTEPAAEARPAATIATPATQAPDPRPVSRLSQVSQHARPRPRRAPSPLHGWTENLSRTASPLVAAH